MGIRTKCFASYFLLATLFNGGHTIECYSCTNCKTVSDTTGTTTCSGNAPVHDVRMKDACVRFEDIHGNIARGCGWSTGEFCLEQTLSAGTGEYCYCNRGLCNDTVKLQVKFAVLLVTVISSLLFNVFL